MTLKLKLKQSNELIDISITDVKFHTLNKQYLVVVKLNGAQHLFRLATVMEVEEFLWYQKNKLTI